MEKALKNFPNSYLLKPFTELELRTSVEIALNKIDNYTPEYKSISVKDGDTTVLLDLNSILFIEVSKNYSFIMTEEKEYTYRSTLKALLPLLPRDAFTQCHRSYIVQLKNIKT